MNKKKFWYVGQVRGQWRQRGCRWEFQGLFGSKVKAIAACRDKNYFISPCYLNEELPHKATGADSEAFYPLI